MRQSSFGAEVETEKRESQKRARGEIQEELGELKNEKNLPSGEEVVRFTMDEYRLLKKATGKEILDRTTLQNFTTQEIEAIEEKSPGLIAMLMARFQERKNEYVAHFHGNKDWEEGISLLHYTESEEVQEITVFIHEKNIEKNSNPELKKLPKVYDEETKASYFIRKSGKRNGENGDFIDEHGPIEIFEGDRWQRTEIWTVEQLLEHKRKMEEENKFDQEYQEKYFSENKEMRKGWGKLMDETIKIAGLKNVPLTHNILWAIVKIESNFNPIAENKSGAFGLGQFKPGTRKGMYEKLKKREIPEFPDSADEEFKFEIKWQLICLALYIKENTVFLRNTYNIDVFSGNPRDIAFLYLAHHDGPGGVQMFANWWKARGKPKEIPRFPNDRLNKKYALKYKNKKKEFQRIRGAKGTNKILEIAYGVAKRALKYQKNADKQAKK